METRASGKTALVTGASSGLGVELAKLFAADGHDVVLVARRRDALEGLARALSDKHGVAAPVIAADLGDPASPRRIFDELAQRGTEIEYLVNNAGFGTSGAFAMGSTAGFQPGPFMATYYASKAFTNAFTEALAYELRGTGVTATVCCPGATATEFSRVAGTSRSRLFRRGTTSAAFVAAHAYRAMMAGKPMSLPGWRAKLGLLMLRIGTRGSVAAVTARLNETPS